MRNQTLALAAITLLLCGTACKKDEAPPPPDLGHAYFPSVAGQWAEYDVDTAWRNDVTGVTGNAQYQLREELTNDFTDAGGRTAQRLHRSMRDTATGAWMPKDVWWQMRDGNQAERAEENQRRIKLIFPPRTNQYWNTNAPNAGQPYELTYAEVDVPWEVNGMHFDSTVLVRTTYPNNAVVSNIYYERYAKHVGLVYRQVDSTNTQMPGGVPKVRGTWYKQVITGYGR